METEPGRLHLGANHCTCGTLGVMPAATGLPLEALLADSWSVQATSLVLWVKIQRRAESYGALPPPLFFVFRESHAHRGSHPVYILSGGNDRSWSLLWHLCSPSCMHSSGQAFCHWVPRWLSSAWAIVTRDRKPTTGLCLLYPILSRGQERKVRAVLKVRKQSCPPSTAPSRWHGSWDSQV